MTSFPVQLNTHTKARFPRTQESTKKSKVKLGYIIVRSKA